MASRFDSIAQRRQVIDRRAVADRMRALPDGDDLRPAAAALLRDTLAAGRAEIARRLVEHPSRGIEAAASYAYLTDAVLCLTCEFAERLTPGGAGAFAVMAVGGYGRAEMAAFSDVDIAFLTGGGGEAAEAVIERVLYLLWDLGLKVGHSTRSLDDMVRQARGDLTVRTALLEGRFVWGDQPLYDQAAARFERDVIAGTARAFVVDKLAERGERHRRMGDSRYVVEPNVKEGKGGLRDLHTLFWIGKYVLGVRQVPELVGAGLLTAGELRQFGRAENFLWAVRCQMHLVAGRAEDRLTFDLQREVAARMRYNDRPGRSAVERFMQHYFRTAKLVGTLTGLFLAHLDEAHARERRRFGLPAMRRRRTRKVDGFTVEDDRLGLPDDGFFAADPVRLLELFAAADRCGYDIHPQAMRAAARDARLIDAGVRADARANALFLGVLTSPRAPATVLRWMNEAGVFGRFVPDFGRVVARMQFDMYHHFTVDEHTIHAIDELSRIEHGLLEAELPVATQLMAEIASRRVLFVAALMHDIAKGRGGDHSVLGAEVAERLCPRLGLLPAETETVAWLVRHHLLMSATAFKRDLSDFKTVLDFAEQVQSPERLKLLTLLTVVDIRAVGPGVWNGWKGQLLRQLYESAEEVLRLGHKQKGRQERIETKQANLAAALGWPEPAFATLAARLPDSYWVAEGPDILEANARMIADADAAGRALSIAAVPDTARGSTLVTVYAADHPGLFYRIAGGIHAAGGSVMDARIHTTRDGMAIDNFLVQDPLGGAFDDPGQLARVRAAIEEALTSRARLNARLVARKPARPRTHAFHVEPNVLVARDASNRFTVIEVHAPDRPALLNTLARALFDSKVTIHSAHIATYGERAVDTFYLTDLLGEKIDASPRLRALEKRLLAAAAGEPLAEAA